LRKANHDRERPLWLAIGSVVGHETVTENKAESTPQGGACANGRRDNDNGIAAAMEERASILIVDFDAASRGLGALDSLGS
jgi:hypothetical protein